MSQEEDATIVNQKVPIPILHTLWRQYKTFYDSVPRPKVPKYSAADLYITLNDPELDAINTAAINEKKKLRQHLNEMRLGGHISKDFFILLFKTVYNRTRRFIQRPTLATFVFLIILGFTAAILSVAIDIFLSKMVAGIVFVL
jgi:hypothetical protein